MNRLIPILITVILLFTVHYAFSQGTWKYYTRADGLAGDSVFAITQDKLGNMWIGTYGAGLSKLDTNGVWTNFFASRDCTVSIVDLEVDQSNNIWMIYFQLGGIYYLGYYVVKYDGSIFYYYEDPDGEPLGGATSPTTLGQDTSGNIWCGSTEDGIVYRFDGQSWQWGYVPGAWAAGHGLISDIETDRYGTLYFAHHGGISTLTKWIRYFYWSFDIAFDRFNRLWFCSYEPGWFLGMFDGENWHAYITDQKIVSRVAVDSTNNIWLNYYINGGIQGAAKFDGSNFTFFNSENGLVQDRVNEIYVDRKGDIWFASDAGLSVLHDTTVTRVKQ
ncbi:MAG TPA: two-component regulator propeller domain-containing protein, partial [bacterium]